MLSMGYTQFPKTFDHKCLWEFNIYFSLFPLNSAALLILYFCLRATLSLSKPVLPAVVLHMFWIVFVASSAESVWWSPEILCSLPDNMDAGWIGLTLGKSPMAALDKWMLYIWTQNLSVNSKWGYGQPDLSLGWWIAIIWLKEGTVVFTQTLSREMSSTCPVNS